MATINTQEDLTPYLLRDIQEFGLTIETLEQCLASMKANGSEQSTAGKSLLEAITILKAQAEQEA